MTSSKEKEKYWVWKRRLRSWTDWQKGEPDVIDDIHVMYNVKHIFNFLHYTHVRVYHQISSGSLCPDLSVDSQLSEKIGTKTPSNTCTCNVKSLIFYIIHEYH